MKKVVDLDLIRTGKETDIVTKAAEKAVATYFAELDRAKIPRISPASFSGAAYLVGFLACEAAPRPLSEFSVIRMVMSSIRGIWLSQEKQIRRKKRRQPAQPQRRKHK
jgi:hypothetical protein